MSIVFKFKPSFRYAVTFWSKKWFKWDKIYIYIYFLSCNKFTSKSSI